MARPLTLALIQDEPVLGDLAANLEQVIRLTGEAAGQGADMVIFPELFLSGYHQEMLGERLTGLSMTVDDEPVRRLAQAAADHHTHLVVGFLEKRAIPGVVYNSILICRPDGSIAGTYAKSHLFASEKLHFRPGASLRSLDLEFGKLGPMICMDIGYPEIARVLCLQGAELLIAPSAWITVDEDIWGLHLQSRALDNLAFVAGINRIGAEGDLHFIGQSMLVDPRGHILARLDDRPGMLVATIDLDDVVRARRIAPRWTGRRPEMYAPVSDQQAN